MLRSILVTAGLLALAALSLTPVLAQTEKVHIGASRYSAGSIPLSEGWLYSPGDDPAWSAADYDDSKWSSIPDTSLARGRMPKEGWDGVGWFRLHFTVDQDLAYEALGLEITQSGASEIYLDGRLVQSFGTIGASRESLRAMDPTGEPVAISLAGQTDHVLAIRYASLVRPTQRPAMMGAAGPEPGFSASITPINANMFTRARRTFIRAGLLSAVAAGLAVFALLNFAMARTSSSDFGFKFLAGFAGFLFVYVGLLLVGDAGHFAPAGRAALGAVSSIAFFAGWIYFLQFLRFTYKRRLKRDFWLALAGYTIAVLLTSAMPFFGIVAGLVRIAFQIGLTIMLIRVPRYAKTSIAPDLKLARLGAAVWILLSALPPLVQLAGFPPALAAALTLTTLLGFVWLFTWTTIQKAVTFAMETPRPAEVDALPGTGLPEHRVAQEESPELADAAREAFRKALKRDDSDSA